MTILEEKWRPRIVPDGPSVDHAGAHRAAVDLLTAALFGQLRDDARSRAEFLDLTRGRR